MKKDRILNPEITAQIAALGHTEYICIADCGLPIPNSVKVIDLSVTAGIPRFTDVLKAVEQELVIQSIVLAKEIDIKNPALFREIAEITGNKPIEKISHEELKERLKSAKCVIRTGETSAYANVLLVGGVNF